MILINNYFEEEDDRKRDKELKDLIQREQDRQRQLLELEAKRIREEEEARLKLVALQEARRIGIILVNCSL